MRILTPVKECTRYILWGEKPVFRRTDGWGRQESQLSLEETG
jgi:hypothetical protein